jgi:hypothetical protein
MDEPKTFIDAVFAYFGDDDPTLEHLEILKARCEPTEEEIEEIAGAHDGEDANKAYCQKVANGLQEFNANPDAHIASLLDDNPRKSGLIEITAAKAARASAPPASVATAAEPAIVAESPVAAAPAVVASAPATAPVARAVDPMLAGVVVAPGAPPALTSAPPRLSVAPPDAPRPPKTDGGKGDRGDKDRGGRGKSDARTDSDEEREPPAVKPIVPVVHKPISPVTPAHRLWLADDDWIGMRDEIICAHASRSNAILAEAASIATSYKAGQQGAQERLLGQLIDFLITDLRAGLNTFDPAEFHHRYWA